jgi:hypothetical protein
MRNDPIVFAGNDTNMYRYVRNCATSLRDPSGCDPLPIGIPNPFDWLAAKAKEAVDRKLDKISSIASVLGEARVRRSLNSKVMMMLENSASKTGSFPFPIPIWQVTKSGATWEIQFTKGDILYMLGAQFQVGYNVLDVMDIPGGGASFKVEINATMSAEAKGGAKAAVHLDAKDLSHVFEIKLPALDALKRKVKGWLRKAGVVPGGGKGPPGPPPPIGIALTSALKLYVTGYFGSYSGTILARWDPVKDPSKVVVIPGRTYNSKEIAFGAEFSFTGNMAFSYTQWITLGVKGGAGVAVIEG